MIAKEEIEEELKRNNEDFSKNGTRKPKKKKRKILKRLLITFTTLIVLGIGTLTFLLYGPINTFRDWLITTAMTTMTHQYLATWFYSDETIAEVMSRNRVIEIDETTNPDLVINTISKEYINEYEKAILDRDESEKYKIIEIKGDTYSGYLAVIYDPSKVKTLITNRIGSYGQYLVDMAKNNNALVAINGGGFDDPNYNSTGGSPLGITISNGKLITNYNYGATGGLIGFNKENILVLGKMNYSKAQQLGIRDAVTCGPFLIVNGKSSEVLGNGGWGDAPRSAIGQRADGIVLFLALDGRRVGMAGADMNDLIQIMENYGAINAANLDGGTSTAMVVNGELINDPINGSGAHKTRPIPTGFALIDE